MPTPPADTAALAFITRWRGITASELSTAQSFVIDLCALLEVDKPHPTPAQDYMFERPVTFRHGDGSSSAGRIDCYRQGAFCLESKKLKSAGHTPTLRQKISALAEQIDQHRKRVLGLLPSNTSTPTTSATPVRVLPGADFWAFDSMRPPAMPEPAHPQRSHKQAPISANQQPTETVQTQSTATEPAKKGSEPKFCCAKLGSDPHLATPATKPAAAPSADITTKSGAAPDLAAPHLATPVTAPAPTMDTTKPAKDLTLTGLYNVLQALREGRALTAKEKQIHSAGLVGVLKTLHDELDGAVLAAYGWGDLANPTLSAYAALTRPANSVLPDSVLTSQCNIKDELLQRLVALNQRRAADETNGQVRWLRPAFQNPLSKTELPAQVQQALEVDFASNPAIAATTQAWPATLPEQVKAVAQVLSASTAALTLAQIQACFSGGSGLKKSLPTLLQTLAALGRAQLSESDGIAVWRA